MVVDTHPFTRTPVLITAIIAGFVFILGLVGIVAFVPDSGSRISSVLTITIPLFLTSMVSAIVAFRTQKIASENSDKINDVANKTDMISQKTDGTLSALVNHVTGTEKLTTAELPIVIQKANDLIAGKDGK